MPILGVSYCPLLEMADSIQGPNAHFFFMGFARSDIWIDDLWMAMDRR
jgi:hypothetical protein